MEEAPLFALCIREQMDVCICGDGRRNYAAKKREREINERENIRVEEGEDYGAASTHG